MKGVFLPPDFATAAGLLSKADQDRAIVKLALNEVAISDAVAGFHAQQATEKSLKAVLAANGIPFPFTHDLTKLIELLDDEAVPLTERVRGARRLTPFAVNFRYADSDDIEVDRNDLAEEADAVLAWADAAVAEAAA